MAALPPGVTAHVLPTGAGAARDESPLAYRDLSAAARRISRAYTASRRYLQTEVEPPSGEAGGAAERAEG